MRARFDVVVVGAGHAGLAIIARLRANGFMGTIGLIGDEPHKPYQRPPLTKSFLQGDMDLQELSLGSDLEALKVEWFTAAVTEIGRENHSVTLADGSTIGFGKLALATGSRPRRLAAADDAEIMYMTTLSEGLVLKDRLSSIEHAMVIGGGFIGLEVAATLRKFGKSVTVIEAQDRLLTRSVTSHLSDYLAALHHRHGVSFRLKAEISSIRKGRIDFSDGTTLTGDAIIAGVGSLPNDELARNAGLACANGILVDEYAQTSDPAIVAAGDCTVHPNEHAPTSLARLESVQNAGDQAITAADTLLGQPTAYRSLPTFWSDQYDARIAMAGISQNADRTVVRGSPENHSFSVFCWRGGRLVAVESVNRPKDQRAARKLIFSQKVTPEQAADPSMDLAALAR